MTIKRLTTRYEIDSPAVGTTVEAEGGTIMIKQSYEERHDTILMYNDDGLADLIDVLLEIQNAS